MYLRRYLRYGPQIFQTTPPYENLKFRVKKVLFSTRRQRAQLHRARTAHFREQAHYVILFARITRHPNRYDMSQYENV